MNDRWIRNRRRALVVGLSMIGAMVPLTAAAGSTTHLTGRVWNDADRDGRQDTGETGVPGIKIELLAAPDGLVVGEATTGPKGGYEIITDRTGVHILRIQLDDNDRLSADDLGVGEAVDSDFPATGESPDLVLNGTDLDLDAGFMLDGPLGEVFFDRDADSRKEAGEPGLSDVKVALVREVDPTVIIATAKTGRNGSYFLPVPHQYQDDPVQIRVFMPPDMSRNQTLEPEHHNYLDATNTSHVAEPYPNEFSFGLLMPVRVGDRVWRDLDRDGRQDAGEPGIAGVLVSLLRGSGEVEVQTVFTDANGKYRLVAPSPGKYRIWVRAPEGGSYSKMRTDLPEDVDSDVMSSGPTRGSSPVFTLKQGGHRKNLDAGITFR